MVTIKDDCLIILCSGLHIHSLESVEMVELCIVTLKQRRSNANKTFEQGLQERLTKDKEERGEI